MKSQPAPSEKIFTRTFALLFLANFVVVSVYFLLITTMATYAVRSFNADGATAGLVASIFLVGGVLGRVFSARYANYLGLRRMTIVALLIQLAACILYFLDALGVTFLIAVRLLHGFSFGLANTAIPALAVEGMPKGRIGEGTGYFMLSNSIATGLGPAVGILMTMGVDYHAFFVICTAATVVGIGAALLAQRSSEGAASHQEDAAKRPRLEPWSLRSIIDLSTVKLSVFMFMVAFSYSAINSFINNYAADLGLGMYGPLVFLVYAAALFVTRPVAGKLMDRYGHGVVLYASTISMAVGLVLAAFVSNAFTLLLLGVFMALGFGTSMSTGQAAATLLTKGNTALAISTFFLLCDSGCGIGPYLLGFVLDAAGYRAMYLLCACIAFAAFLYCLFVACPPRRFKAKDALSNPAPSA